MSLLVNVAWLPPHPFKTMRTPPRRAAKADAVEGSIAWEERGCFLCCVLIEVVEMIEVVVMLVKNWSKKIQKKKCVHEH